MKENFKKTKKRFLPLMSALALAVRIAVTENLKKIPNHMKQKTIVPALPFLLPSLFGVGVFYAVPFAVSVFFTFTQGVAHPHFAGLQNFRELWDTAVFRQALGNTVLFLTVGLCLLLALALFAALVCAKGRFAPQELALLLPMVIPVNSFALGWQSLWGQNGAVNRLLGLAGREPVDYALPAHKAYAGFALDGDSLYFTDGETIYCAAPPYDAVESVGYLPSLDTSARLPALMVDNCYCVCNAELGFFAAQLHTAPRCTLRVDARLSNVNRALVSQYLRAHPDVAVVYAPHNASTAPEYRQHMESGDALDIYAFTLPNESFIPLRDKGDLLDLRPLMGADTPDSLLPQVLAPLEKAGGLFAIPCGAPSVSCWFLDQSSLESLGLTDVPATYADLMTLISTYLTDFASDSDVALADNPGGMADSLFQQLFWAQLARCEASGVLPTFTDADFVAALRQYIALRPALVDYETRWLAERSSSLGDLGDTGGIVTVLSVSSSQPSLLHLNTSLTPSKTDEVPLLLSFSEGGALLIPMTYPVLAVNRRSAYPDDAASLLSYLLDNQPYDAKLALLPDYAALQPNPAYTEAAQKILDDEALYMQYRATLSPLEQKQAEDILADARAALHQIPPNVYSAAEIATYHARLNHTHLLESSFWVSGDQHVSTLRQRLLDGECTVETFVQELTRIVQMMTLENGVSS